MKSSDFSQLGVVTVVLLLLVSTTPATAFMGSTQPQSTTPVAADQTYYNVSSDVEVWERAMLPLRTDPATAETAVETHSVFVSMPEMKTGDVPVNKQQLAIYGAEAEITVEFQGGLGADTSAFAGENVQLLAVKVSDADTISATSMWSDMPESFNQPFDLIDGTTTTDEATYELLDAGTVTEEGTADATYDLSASNRGAGQYVFFLVANGMDGDGITVDSESGELSVTGDSKVLGVDMALAHERPSNIAPTSKSIEPGQDISFALSDADTQADLNHTVVLYDESTYSDSRLSVDLTGELDRGLSEDNVTLSHSVDEVNGAFHVVDGSDTAVRSGSLNLTKFIGFGETGTNLPITDADEGTSVVLDASLTTQIGSTAAVSVETFSNWSSGEYRWVHLATAPNGSVVSSDTGTIDVRTANDDERDTDDDDDTNSEDDDVDGSDSTDSDTDGATDDTAAVDGVTSLLLSSDSAEAQISQANSTGEYELNFTEEPITRNGISVSSLLLQMGESAGNFSVKTSLVDTVPENISQPPTATAGFISVETDAPESAFTRAEFRFTVSQDRLDALGVTSDEVTLYRYHDGEWTALETRHVNGTAFVAETPGFSYFAIGSSSEAGGEGMTGTAGDNNDVDDENADQTTPGDDGQQENSFPLPLLAVLAIVAIAIAAGVVYTQRE